MRYAAALTDAGFERAETQRIIDAGGSQFLRSVLLTESVRRHGIRGNGGVDRTLAVVLAREDDQAARRVVSLFDHQSLGTEVALWTHDDLLRSAANQPELEAWAQQMQRRYVL